MSTKMETAIDFLHQLNEQRININVCDMNEKGLEIIGFGMKEPFSGKKPGKSSSSSDIRYGTLYKKNFFRDVSSSILEKKESALPVTLKFFVEPEKISNDYAGLFYEIEVYKYIMERVIEPKVSPNFISYVASGSCKYSEIKSFVNCDQKCYDNLSKVKREQMILLVTENANNGAKYNQDKGEVLTFHQWLRDEKFDVTQEYAVIFQIIYSLEVMNRLRITHTDLHAGNILVTKFKNPIVLYYIYEFAGNVYNFRIETRYIPYIFDWDFSSVRELGRNKKLDSFKKLLMDEWIPYRDLYTLFCTSNWRRFTKMYLNKVSELNEMKDKKYIEITEKEYEQIVTNFPLYENIKNTYKVKKEDLEKIIPEKILDSITAVKESYVVFEILRNKKFYIYLYDNFYCRLTSISSSLLRPSDIILLSFQHFRVDNVDQKTNLVFDIRNLKDALTKKEKAENYMYRGFREGNIKIIRDAMLKGADDFAYSFEGACLGKQTHFAKCIWSNCKIEKNRALYFAIKSRNSELANFIATKKEIEKFEKEDREDFEEKKKYR